MELKILGFFYIFFVVKHASSLAIQNNDATNPPISTQKSSLSSQLYTLITSKLNSTKLVLPFSTQLKPLLSSQRISILSEIESSVSLQGSSLRTSLTSKKRLLTDTTQTNSYFSPQIKALISSRQNSVVSKISMSSQLKSSTMQLKSSIKDTRPTKSERWPSTPINEVPVLLLNRRGSEKLEHYNRDKMGKKGKKKGSSKLKEENLYEPYWPNGEWVFGRPIKPYMTRWWGPTEKGETTTTVTPPTTVAPIGNTTSVLVDPLCQFHCNPIYESYGPICGFRMDTLKNDYVLKPFTNYCDMMYSNLCDREHRGLWYAEWRGTCREYLDLSKRSSTDVSSVLERARKYSTLDIYSYRPQR